jgi:hypothetical protein
LLSVRLDAARVAPRAVDGLRQREAVGVVGHPHLAIEQRAEVAMERVADQLGRVGVLHEARGGRDRAGDAYADARVRAERGLGLAHQPGDRLQDRGVGAARRRAAAPEELRAVRPDRDRLDLRAAKVDADAQSRVDPHAMSLGLPNLKEMGMILPSSLQGAGPRPAPHQHQKRRPA